MAKTSEIINAERKKSTVTKTIPTPLQKKKVLKCFGNTTEENHKSFFLPLNVFEHIWRQSGRIFYQTRQHMLKYSLMDLIKC